MPWFKYYQPKIDHDLIKRLRVVAKAQKIPATKLLNQAMSIVVEKLERGEKIVDAFDWRETCPRCAVEAAERRLR